MGGVYYHEVVREVVAWSRLCLWSRVTMKRALRLDGESCASVTSKRVKKEPEDVNGYCHNDDDDQSTASDPGQPVAVNLPVNILETVFAHLSVQDMINCSLVCARWSTICRREKFMFWKKSYLKLKRGRNWDEWARENGITITHPTTMECLMDTARSVQQVFTGNTLLVDGGDEEKLCTTLSHHPQYTNAIGVIHRDSVIQHIQDSSLLPATVCLLVTLSRDVFEVRKVFLLLTAPGSPCCLMTVVDLFYCIATFFYRHWTEDVLPQRYHYKVYYVLALFEQPSLPPHREGVVSLTCEQSRIVNHPIKSGDVVKVVAFAGTGKTTTLLHFALAHPNHQFLYLVYNKSVQELASKVFPDTNVTCKTLHSLAYEYTGVAYQHKLDHGSLPYDIPEFIVEDFNLERPGGDKITVFELNQLALKTLKNYFTSTDEEIVRRHLPILITKRYLFPDHAFRRLRELVMRQAKRIWKAMKDVDDQCPMAHDGYLKLFQLLRPRPQVTGYDCILIDESQDLSPAILDILSHLTCPKIFVGDLYQQISDIQELIYEYDAMDTIEPTHSYYLTKSFRFGPNIAFLASVMLSELKSVHQQTLTGGLQEGGYYGEHDESEEKQVAIIARFHCTLLRAIFYRVRAFPDTKVALVGGLPSYLFPTLEDVYHLKHNQRDKMKSSQIKKFKTIEDLQKDAETTEDMPLTKMIKLCETFDDIPKCIELVNKNGLLTRDISEADIVYCTIHSAKGLEFHTVEISDDLLEEASESGELKPEMCTYDELNLLYVTITRATHFVNLCISAVDVLDQAKEYPVMHCMSSSVAKITDGCCDWDMCALNDDDLYPDDPILVPLNTYFPIYRIPLNTFFQEEGPLCNKCVKVFYPELEPFFMNHAVMTSSITYIH